MFLSWLRRSTQSRSKAAKRHPIHLRLESLEDRIVLSADNMPSTFYNPISAAQGGPVYTPVDNQITALEEAEELTSQAIWGGPPFGFGQGQDATALAYQAGASGPAAAGWSALMSARALVNQELALYNQNPNLGWSDPDTYNGGHGTYQMNQLAVQADRALPVCQQAISELENQVSGPGSPTGTGNGTTPVLQGHVEVNVPAQGPMNWWQEAQNAVAKIMDGLGQQFAAFADSVNQWESDFYDSGLKAFLTFGQQLDRDVDGLGAYLTSNAAANEAAQLNAVGKWFTNNAVDNQVQAVQGVENGIQYFKENPAAASADGLFALGTGAVLGGASGALDGMLFSGGLESAAATAVQSEAEGLSNQQLLKTFSEGLNSAENLEKLDQQLSIGANPNWTPSQPYQTTAALIRGNEGERLMQWALASDNQAILWAKSEIMGTNQGGVDIIAMKLGAEDPLNLIDNKAFQSGRNISSVPALTTNLDLGEVRAILQQGLDNSVADLERQVWQLAIQKFDAGNINLVVSNAGRTIDSLIPPGITARLQQQELTFLNAFNLGKTTP